MGDHVSLGNHTFDRRHSRHRLSEAVVSNPEHQGIGDLGMGLERLFDLFRVDLLAGRIDAMASSPEEADRSVGLNESMIPAEDMADTIDRNVGSSGSLGVLVVAERNVTGLCDDADLP